MPASQPSFTPPKSHLRDGGRRRCHSTMIGTSARRPSRWAATTVGLAMFGAGATRSCRAPVAPADLDGLGRTPAGPLDIEDVARVVAGEVRVPPVPQVRPVLPPVLPVQRDQHRHAGFLAGGQQAAEALGQNVGRAFPGC